MENNICILYSGGLDSLTMLELAKMESLDFNCVWFDIGQPYNIKEEKCLPEFVEKRKIDWIRSEKELHSKDNESGNIYIPGRNFVLTTLAASIYLPDKIWLGVLAGEDHDKATDKNNTFRYRTNVCLEYVYSPYKDIKLIFPLLDNKWNKLDCVRFLLGRVPVEEIHNSSSCLSGEEGNCGRCIVCLRRWGIFGQLGIPEKYNVDPLTHPDNIKIMKEMIVGSYYDDNRKEEIIPFLLKNFNVDAPKYLLSILDKL